MIAVPQSFLNPKTHDMLAAAWLAFRARSKRFVKEYGSDLRRFCEDVARSSLLRRGRERLPEQDIVQVKERLEWMAGLSFDELRQYWPNLKKEGGAR